MILTREYFSNEDTVFLARDLLGKALVRKLDDGTVISRIITETEAYHGEDDGACHARFGKTKRTEIMYAEGGYWYVYLCYGIHWLLNIINGTAGFPSAILIRGVNQLAGPGKVTKFMQIDKSFYGKVACLDSGLWIADVNYQPQNIIATPRIGVDYAGICALKLWRFVAQG